MAKQSIILDAEMRLNISENTIRLCLAVLGVWQDQHPDQYIEGNRLPDGSTKFRIVKRNDPARGDTT